MAAKKTSTPAQKAAQARLRSASKAAKAKGLKGAAFRAEVGRLTKGKGGTKTSSPARGGRARAAAGTALTTVRHKTHGFFRDLSPRKVMQGAVMVDGFSEAWDAYDRDYGDDFWLQLQQTLLPIVDAGFAAKGIGRGSTSSTFAPGLTGELLNWHFLSKPLPKLTVRRVVNAIPSGMGWSFGTRRFRELRAQNPDVGDYNMLPRTGALLGLRLRNARKVKGPWIETMDKGQPRRELALGLGTSPAAAAGAGGFVSKTIAQLQFI